MWFQKSKYRVGAIWLGPLEDRAQVLNALKQYQAALKRRSALLPIQKDGISQRIAENVTRKLDSSEVMAMPDSVNNFGQKRTFGRRNSS